MRRITHRTPTRGFLCVSLGRCTLRFPNCASFSQKQSQIIGGLPSETVNYNTVRSETLLKGPALVHCSKRFVSMPVPSPAFRQAPCARWQSGIPSAMFPGGSTSRVGMQRFVWLIGFGVLCLSASAVHAASSMSSVARVPQATVRPIASMTAAERATLPDATVVTLKTGRTVSLGVLRSEHRARMARFAAVSSARLNRNIIANPGIISNQPPVGTLVVMKPVTSGPIDYRTFCNASPVSGCLYFPPGAELYPSYPTPDHWRDSDPLIMDAGVCASEGGTSFWDGCYYDYPMKYTGNFNPGVPPAGQSIGTGVTSTKNCAGTEFDVTVDTHGAVQINAPGSIFASPPVVTSYLTTGPSPAKCVVKVYVPG